MADFLTAYQITARNEGGLVNDPSDSGCFTYCGITERDFPGWPGWPTVHSRPFEEGAIYSDLAQLVQDFYRQNFWDPIGGDSIPLQDLANQVYDEAINAGVYEALKLLAQA